MTNSKVEIYIPIQNRPPNQFVRYEMRPFKNTHGSGMVRVAIYLNKNKKESEVEAQIIWDEQPFSKEWEEKYGKNYIS